MGTAKPTTRAAARAWLVLLLSIPGAALAAQESESTKKPAATEQGRTDQNGVGTAATHAPQPDLSPLFAWNFVMQGNADYVAARAEEARLMHNKLARPVATTSPHEATASGPVAEKARPKRPAGAGKYVCCVITCADFATPVAPLLGLQAKDVLELRLAGPFLTAEAIALIERTIQAHRLSLVLLLSHEPCESLRLRKQGTPDALDRSLIALHRRAKHLALTPSKTVGLLRREWMLTSSNLMQAKTHEDRLRIVPGVLNERTGAIAWQHRSAQQLPISPIK